jgi:hypothetical protein
MNELMALGQRFDQLEAENRALTEQLVENLSRKMLELEDIGWTPLTGNTFQDEDSGLELDALHTLSKRLRDEAVTNPLHVRGAQLRKDYVFGRGMYLTGLGDKVQALVDDPYNKTALFSADAYETNNLTLFTDGNLIVLRNEKTNELSVIPLTQITEVALDPDDNSKVRYLKRVWTTKVGGKPVEKQMWYPLARFKKSRVGRGKRRSQTGGIQKSFTSGGKRVEVSQDTVAYLHTTKRQSGWTFGVPDSLAALVWSQAYKEYLADNATLVKALSQLAWKVTTTTKTGQDNAAAQVKLPGGVGGAVVTGNGNDVSAVSRGAGVDFNNGQPLAAMVAASFGVAVIALLSSPGATGGSYGAAQTLDEPTLKGMRAIQDSWIEFYREILVDMGAENPVVSFPNISEDPTYRALQSLAQAYATGAISQREYRDAVLELLDVLKQSDALPKPDNFNAGHLTPQEVADNAKAQAEMKAKDPIARQGNTGSVPGGTEQDVTNHDNDE